jgi:hypothetical protein
MGSRSIDPEAPVRPPATRSISSGHPTSTTNRLSSVAHGPIERWIASPLQAWKVGHSKQIWEGLSTGCPPIPAPVALAGGPAGRFCINSWPGRTRRQCASEFLRCGRAFVPFWRPIYGLR